jgi:carbon monoxide dehydrogenase subunit G
MMNIKSDTIYVDASASQVFSFLNNFNNYQKLMPEQVIRWDSDEKSGRFTIKDLTELGLRIEEAMPEQYVLLHSDGKVPFDFTLKFMLVPMGEQTEVSCEFEGNMSSMIAMMARRPLTNLVNHMVGEISDNV